MCLSAFHNKRMCQKSSLRCSVSIVHVRIVYCSSTFCLSQNGCLFAKKREAKLYRGGQLTQLCFWGFTSAVVDGLCFGDLAALIGWMSVFVKFQGNVFYKFFAKWWCLWICSSCLPCSPQFKIYQENVSTLYWQKHSGSGDYAPFMRWSIVQKGFLVYRLIYNTLFCSFCVHCNLWMAGYWRLFCAWRSMLLSLSNRRKPSTSLCLFQSSFVDIFTLCANWICMKIPVKACSAS